MKPYLHHSLARPVMIEQERLPTPPPPQSPPPQQTNRPPFPSGQMDCIIDPSEEEGAVFLSGVEAAENPEFIKNNNIQSILTIGEEMAHLQFNVENHKIIDIYDMAHLDIRAHFHDCFQFIDDSRRKGNVLVHCFVGVSRSATIIIAYLMKKLGLAFFQAFHKVAQRRPLINPNPGFLKQLEQFDTDNREVMRASSLERPSSVNSRSFVQLTPKVENRRQSENPQHKLTSVRESCFPVHPLTPENRARPVVHYQSAKEHKELYKVPEVGFSETFSNFRDRVKFRTEGLLESTNELVSPKLTNAKGSGRGGPVKILRTNNLVVA